jgi:hypothetical protein
MDLKTKIKETLLEERKRKLEESFSALQDIRDTDFLAVNYISITTRLLDEGYSPNEIISHLNEVDLNIPTSGEDLKKLDWKGIMGDTMISGLKEYAIQYVLSNVFGANKGLSITAAQIFADYNPLDLLKPFKNAEMCNSYMPKLVNSLLEALIRYLASEATGTDRGNYDLNVQGIATSASGNLFGEVLRSTNVANVISDKVCQMIH